MRIFTDTNVVIDFLSQREPFFEKANKIFELIALKEIEGVIGSSSVTDIYYITKQNFHNSKKALSLISDLLELVLVADTKLEYIKNALKLKFSDFEDAVIAATANEERVDCILTRNVKDFKYSPIKAIDPNAFLSLR